MVKEEIKELLEQGYGWEEIPSKNPYMWSFKHDNERMNIYFSTRTVTIQSPGFPIKTYKNITNIEDILL